MKFYTLLAMLLLSLSGCSGSWSATSVSNTSPSQAAAEKKSPQNVQITTEDITDKKYESLGDIKVTVNKTTIFNSDPTREQVDTALQEKAAEMGADAVVLVRYGDVGVSFMSWGSLEGKGRAVRFLE